MILAILQARMSSTRLPGKVLMPVKNTTMLGFEIERIRQSRLIDKLIIATSTDPSDDIIAAQDWGVDCCRGDLQDVLARFAHCASSFNPDHVVRLTGDCPVIDPEIIDHVIQCHLTAGKDYTTNALERSYPDGLDVEVIRFDSLMKAHDLSHLQEDREHVTHYIYTHPELFTIQTVTVEQDHSHLRWTLDTPQDYTLLKMMIEKQPDPYFGWQELLDA